MMHLEHMISRKTLVSFAALFISLAAISVGAAPDIATTGTRSTISLNGEWEALAISGFKFAYPPPNDGWQQEKVPNEGARLVECPNGPYIVHMNEMLTPDGKDFRRHDKIACWFRRTFDAPASLPTGQRAVLHFEGMSFRSLTWLNGKQIGDCVLGQVPQDYDVSNLLKYGQPNLLVVGVAGRESIIDLPSKSFIAPADGAGTGIWGDVSLQIVPKTMISDVFIKTSVREKRIDLETTVFNKSDRSRTLQLSGYVVDDSGELQTSFAAQSVNVAPNASAVITLKKDWLAPRLWAPVHPILYTAHLSLRESNQSIDEITQRFGFREFWIQGRDFYLNGAKTTLLRNSFLTSLGNKPERVEQEMHVVLGRPYNSIRLHRGFNNSAVLDAADKLGFMTLPELSWNSCAADYDMANTEKWLPNVLEYERKFIKMHRNRPSIVIWNLTNETFWGETRADWMKVAESILKTARETDPTRPQEGDAEVTWGGRLPIINIHYPDLCGSLLRDYPNSGLVVPNSLYWLDQPWDGKVHGWRADFVWDRPLVIGEYWNPGGMADDYASFMGEEAYDWVKFRAHSFMGLDGYQPNGYIDALTKATDIYRLQGVAGLNAWAGDRQQVMPPVCVRQMDFHPNFYGGQTGKRKVAVFCDMGVDIDYPKIQYLLTIDGRVVMDKTLDSVKFASLMELPIECPAVDRPVKGVLTVRFKIHRGSDWSEIAHYEETIHIMPHPVIKGIDPADIVLLDTTGATAAAYAKLGLTLTPKKSVAKPDLAKAKLLIVGSGVDAGPFGQVISNFVSGGGRALLLSAENVAGVSTEIPEVDSKHVASRVWLRSHGSAALGGLTDPQLSYWLPDNLVSNHTMYKPSNGKYKILLDAGGIYGMHWTPLVEVPSGTGKYVVSQLNLVDRAGIEPAADTLLASLVSATLSAPVPRGFPLKLMVGNNPALMQAITTASVVTTQDEKVNGPVLLDASYTPTPAEIEALKARLAAGWVVWLHGFTPETVGRVAELMPFKPVLVPVDKTIQSAARCSDDRIMDSLSSYDFCWTRQPLYSDAYFQGGQPTASIGSYVLSAPTWQSATRLIEPGLLCRVPVGKGTILFDTMPWENAMAAELDKAMRLLTSLTLNIGGDISVEPPKSYKYTQLDISKQANRGYYDEVAGDGKGGWTDQGENDMRYFLIDHYGKVGGMDVSTGKFPAEATFLDRPFKLVNPKDNGDRAVITLRGQGHDLAAPASVNGIVANCKADKLWFLQSECWATNAKYKEVQARYMIHYSDGSSEVFPLREGVEIADWWDMKPLAAARAGWTGRNGVHAPVGMYVTEWTNPHPDKTISTIDIEGNITGAQLVVVGITAGEETAGNAQAAKPVAEWNFSAMKDGKIPSTIAGGDSLTLGGEKNAPLPKPAEGGGLRFAHGSSVFGPIKSYPGGGDGGPWSVVVDLTVEEKPDGYCSGIFSAPGWRLTLGQGNMKVTAEIAGSDGKQYYLSSKTPLTFGRDYKVRVVFDGKRALMYLNNRLDSMLESPFPKATAGDFTMGVAGGQSYYFNGVIRSVAIIPSAKP